MPKKFGFRKNRRGQGLVEYIVIVASVALIALVSVSMFGHKLADQYAVGAGMLPGAHAEDNNSCNERHCDCQFKACALLPQTIPDCCGKRGGIDADARVWCFVVSRGCSHDRRCRLPFPSPVCDAHAHLAGAALNLDFMYTFR